MNVSDLPTRIATRIEVDPESGCWVWTGTLNGSGYGVTGMRLRSRLAHRAVYTMLVGEIPDGLELDHACHTGSDCEGGKACPHRRCVNPAHLSVETRLGNIMLGNSFSARNARKTECVNGHPFTSENTRVGKPGHRVCRTCERAHVVKQCEDRKRRRRELGHR